jgi:hypothetical protein
VCVNVCVCVWSGSGNQQDCVPTVEVRCALNQAVLKVSVLIRFIARHVNFDPRSCASFLSKTLRKVLRISKFHTVNQLVKAPFGYVFSFTNLCISLRSEGHLYIILSVYPSITGLRTREASVGSCKQINRLSASCYLKRISVPLIVSLISTKR